MKEKIRYGMKGLAFTHDGLERYELHFRCGEDIPCCPSLGSYVKGRLDVVWAVRKTDLFDKAAVERRVGMRVLPYDNPD
jgi:hypothetical protein